MLTKGYWAHNSPTGEQPWKWFEDDGSKYANAGENLAKNFHTSKDVTVAWMNSSSHRKNILNSNFKDVGIAVVNGKLDNEETTLVVALFGTKQSEATASNDSNGNIISNATNSKASSIFAQPAQIQALVNPVSLSTIAILLSVLIVALFTHLKYINLPKKVRSSWYQHHALYTACIALLCLVYVAYIFTSGTI